MFNLGGDDKEKLKENMEEIKELVNSQAAEDNISDEGLESAQQNIQSQAQNQSEQSDAGSSQENSHTGIAEIKNEIESAIHRGNPNQENNENNEEVHAQNTEVSMEELSQQGMPPVENNPGDNVENPQGNVMNDPVDESIDQQMNNLGGNSNRQSVENNNDSGLRSRSFDREIENLNQDNGLDNSTASNPGSPSSDGDKLFIEVDDFKNIKEKVDEMKYLSREMKDLMANLEDGIDEDRRLQGEAQDVLKDFSKRRESIQASIK